MRLKSAKRLFVLGSLAGLVTFFILTVDTLGKVPLRSNAQELEGNSSVVAGKGVWQHYACMDCHTILGNGAYFAPDLTKVYRTRGPSWLKAWLADPLKVDSASVMPNLHISPQEAADLISFFDWVSRVDTNDWPPKPVKAPEQVVREGFSLAAALEQNGCLGCHLYKGVGSPFGPDLTNEGSKRDRDWLNRWLDNPAAVKPNAAMVRPDLTPELRNNLAQALAESK